MLEGWVGHTLRCLAISGRASGTTRGRWRGVRKWSIVSIKIELRRAVHVVLQLVLLLLLVIYAVGVWMGVMMLYIWLVLVVRLVVEGRWVLENHRRSPDSCSVVHGVGVLAIWIMQG